MNSDYPVGSPTDFDNFLESYNHTPFYHLLFEVFLILAVIYLKLLRKPRPIEKKFLEREKEELIDEWQPEPFVPNVDPNYSTFNV